VLALGGGIKEEISSFFEGGEHDGGVFEFIDVVAGESDDPALAGHDLREQVDVPRVYVDSVLFHCFGYLVYDALSRCLDPQTFLNFCYVVGVGSTGVHTKNAEYFFEAEPFGIDDMSILAFLADESAIDGCDTSYNNIAKLDSEGLELKHEVCLADRNDVDCIRSHYFRFFYFALQGMVNRVFYFLYSQLDLQVLHYFAVDVDV
jgi:hypothetical protein